MATLACKPGVQPPLLWLLTTIGNVAATLTTVPVVTITAGIDGSHSRASKHYQLAAVDIRTRDFPTAQAKRDFMAALTLSLGMDYDVLLEDEGTANEHLHIEYDAKR